MRRALFRTRARRRSRAASRRPTRSASRGRSTSRTGAARRVWDVDGNEMIDFHNGFGAMVQGHAHPAIVRRSRSASRSGRISRRRPRTRSSSREELAARFGLPRWRFVNSGSEATMDAIRIARACTGRDTIIKIFGSYHGHHDYVMVSIGVAVRRDRRPGRTTRRCRTARASRRRRRPDDRGAVQRRRRRWSGGSSGSIDEGRRRPA